MQRMRPARDLLTPTRKLHFIIVSVLLLLVSFSLKAQDTYRDNFGTVSYNNNDGTQNWSGSWDEDNDNNNPNSGNIRIESGVLTFQAISRNDERISRSANLSGYGTAFLSFDYRAILNGGNDATSENLAVQVSSDGVNFTTVGTIYNSNWTTFNVDISAFISNNTTIRFINLSTWGSGDWENNNYVFIDNLQILAFATSIQFNQPLVLFDEFDGYIDYTSTGGSLRTQPNGVNACAIASSSSNTLTSPVPAGATIQKAYLYWAHSGATPDTQVTFEGNSVNADWVYATALGSRTFYGGVSDVTSIITGISNLSTNTFDFSDLTVDNSATYCNNQTVLGGWALFIVYEDLTLPASTINLYQGFNAENNSSSSFTLSGFFAIGSNGSKTTVMSWEGDQTLSNNEDLTVTTGLGTFRLSGDGDNNGVTTVNPFNSTIFDNTVIPNINNTTSYGLDLDTYDVSPYVQPGESSVTTNVQTGQDLVIMNAVVLKVPSNIISGVVFEDVNYGGGSGRDRVTASGVPIPGATVELYDVLGNLVDTKVTNNNGRYIFAGMQNGIYRIRVVNNTVRSTRTGGSSCSTCIPVQTFRRDYALSSFTDVTNEVGGANPAGQDPGPGTITGAQSVSVVTINSEGAVGLDFGFNFNTIVNTNATGQGSLAQFIENANNLGNSGINIEANSIFDPAAGQDVSIFMIPSNSDPLGRTTDPNFSGGVATITATTILPVITDDNTHIDGRTQTANIGDTNTGTVGTGGTVGVDAEPLPTYQLPEIAINADNKNGLRLNGATSNVVIRNLAIYNAVHGINATGNGGSGTNRVVSNMLLGTLPNGNDPGSSLQNTGYGVRLVNPSELTVTSSYIAYNQDGGVLGSNNNASLTVTYNEIFQNGSGSNSANAVAINGDNSLVQYNLIYNQQTSSGNPDSDGGSGIEIGNTTVASGNNTIDNNTIYNNISAGINVRNGANNNTISKNIVYGNEVGVAVNDESRATAANTITQNSIYNNNLLGIDLHGGGSGIFDGVTLNDLNDTDSGSNDLVNFPVFDKVVIDDSQLYIKGWARPGAIIELFITDISSGTASPGDNQLGMSQDYGEGQTFLASLTEGSGSDLSSATSSYTDVDGNTDNTNEFEFVISLPSGVNSGTLLTATATVGGSTSEFSSSKVVRRTDFGDAPNSYNTNLASNGPRHGLSNSIYLGASIPDAETDGQPSADATGDGAEDDGVLIGASSLQDQILYAGQPITFTVVAGSSDATTGYLNAWIDLNGDGDFADAGEKIIDNQSLSVGNNSINYTIPDTATAGITFARFRYSSQTLSTSDGFAYDGEVEDYRVTIQNVLVEFASSSYEDDESNTDSPVLILNQALSSPLTVDLTVTGGTATSGSDFSNTVTVTIPAGVTTYTIPTSVFSVTDDNLVEPSETIQFTLANPQAGLVIGDANNNSTSQNTTTYTITDNDSASLAIDDVTVTEGGDLVFTVSLTGDVQGGVSVDYASSDNTAVAGSDYTSVSGTLNFTGTDGETQTITVSTTDDTLVEPTEDFTITLSNTTPSSVTISDATGIGTITDNDADVQDDTASTDEDTSVTIDVLANDTYGSDDTVSVVAASDPANGTVTIEADGTITYVPDPDFNGVDTFAYTVEVTHSDGSVTTETSTVTVTVNPVQDAQDDTAVTDQDTPVTIDVLANDTFNASSTVAVISTSNPSNGNVTIETDGTVTYTPNAGFTGTDSFTYTVQVTHADGSTTTETATVTVTVNAGLNAEDDVATTDENVAVTIDVLANDVNVPTNGTLTVTAPANGTVVINDNGTPSDPSDDTVTYTPNADYSGTDTFTYTICDTSSNCDTATVVITVNPVNNMDTDGDGVPDAVDIDDDNDGILDVDEDLNMDGDDDPSTTPTDTDGDGVPDYLDIDSDNDGIPDNVEAQPTEGYIPPTPGDSDGDGLLDVYEFGGNEGLLPEDTDDDFIPDYLDEDSDNDGSPDNIEGHDFDNDGEPENTFRGSDKDGDGLDDGYEGESALDTDPNDEIEDPASMLPNTNNTGDVDYRDDLDVLGVTEGLIVYNIVTPNGDGKHDFLEIEGIEDFPENTVKIFNRWGVMVYETESYNNINNNFRGMSKGRVTVKQDEMLPTGTYYYVIEYVNSEGKKVSLANYLYLNR